MHLVAARAVAAKDADADELLPVRDADGRWW